jgi:hypothetical protein
MDFSDVFVDSLRYPFTDLKRFLVVLVLFLGSSLLIPLIIGYGYMYRIIEHTLEGKEGLPDFSKVEQLLVNGIKIIVVHGVYGIPTLVVTFLLLKQINLNSLSSFTSFLSPINMIITLILGFFVTLVFVIGLANMVHENRIMAAFEFKRIFQLIKKIGWKKYLAYIAVYSIIVALISYIPYAFAPILSPTSIGSTSIGGVYGFLLISYLLNAYVIAFGSRFKGLIYPLTGKKIDSTSKI